MKKVLILFIAMITFGSINAFIPSEIDDTLEMVVDVGSPMIATLEVSADASSTATSTDCHYVQLESVGSESLTAQMISKSNSIDVDWRIQSLYTNKEMLNQINVETLATNVSKRYRRTDHDYIRSIGDSIVTKTSRKRTTIRFPAV